MNAEFSFKDDDMEILHRQTFYKKIGAPERTENVFPLGKIGISPNVPLAEYEANEKFASVSAIRTTLLEWMGPQYQQQNYQMLYKMLKIDFIQRAAKEFPDTIIQIIRAMDFEQFVKKLKPMEADIERTINNKLYERAAITSIFAHLSDYFGTDDFFEEHCRSILAYLKKFCRIEPEQAATLDYDSIIKKNILSQEPNNNENINEIMNILQKKMKFELFKVLPDMVLALKFLYAFLANGTIQTQYNFGALINVLQLIIDNKNPYDRYVDEYMSFVKR